MSTSVNPGAAILMIDLDLADTFLAIAETHRRVEQIRKRNVANAERACDEIIRLSTILSLAEADLSHIEDRILALQMRIQGIAA